MSGIKKFAKSKPKVEEEMNTEMDIIPEVKEAENNEKTDFENEIEEPKVPENTIEEKPKRRGRKPNAEKI